MKRKSVYTCLVMLLMSLALQAKDKDVAVAEALLKRLLPSYIESFQFQKLKGEKDCFTIESVKDKIVIGGNNANSMAMGLNHYLKYYCLTTVSWYADIAVEIPEELPMVGEKVVSEARVDTRFFLNYCTYGYTMPWWQWKEWERFIDWMALNGINMPLAITGQEAVWYKVWSKMGMSDIEIRSYFTGPPYLPWHRMANIDRWNGPLPMEWLEHQVSLQKKILARERELNMKPVLPAFAGHVPADLKRIYPEADIQHLGKWAGFADAYRCNFLNPNDALFAKIQKLFLDEQKKLFGTDHIYGLDPFNEVDPPSFEPEYLRKIASDMYATLTAADPKAQWMQMTWMFYFDKDKWTSERMKALLTGVPQNKMILLDYHCENVELWKRTLQICTRLFHTSTSYKKLHAIETAKFKKEREEKQKEINSIQKEINEVFIEAIQELREQYPKLTQEDLFYCILQYLRLSTSTIKFCMRVESNQALTQRKYRIKKQISPQTFSIIFNESSPSEGVL